MSAKTLSDAMDTYSELLYLHQLNLELLETLEMTLLWLRDLQENHNICIPNKDKIATLLEKAETLIGEISSPKMFLQHRMPSDEFSQRRNPTEFHRTLKRFADYSCGACYLSVFKLCVTSLYD